MLFEEALAGVTRQLYSKYFEHGRSHHPDGTDPDLIMPDPRENPRNQSSDPFIEYVNGLLPEGNTPHWIDD